MQCRVKDPQCNAATRCNETQLVGNFFGRNFTKIFYTRQKVCCFLGKVKKQTKNSGFSQKYFILFIALIISSSGMYLVEKDVQPASVDLHLDKKLLIFILLIKNKKSIHLEMFTKFPKLFENKKNPGTYITSPSSGVVRTINRGEKRRFVSLIIDTDNTLDQIQFDLNKYSNSIDFLVDSGALAYFRTRPYNRMPESSELPSAIFINACDTNPLSVDPHELIKLDQDLFNKGLHFIQAINSDIKTFCSFQDNAFDQSVQGVNYNQFSGPHPAGLVGTHIHFLYPVGQNRTVWSISWQEVISLGFLIQNQNQRS